MLLPATSGWVPLPVVVGGPRHSRLRSPGGGGVWWGCGWCVVWLVPRHSWRRFLCATSRHSWLGFAAGGGVQFPATPGWGLLAAVVRGVWCVVCGVWCAAVVCWWGCGCGWSLATPGGGPCVLLPATPGWVPLPVAVGGPRHSWLRALGAVPRHSWLGSAGGGGVWLGLCLVCGVVGPSPLLEEVPVCYSTPLLAGFRCRWWCAVPRHSWLGPAGGGGAWCVVCGVWCVVCGVWRWCVGGVVAGVWCGWSLATPGGGSCVLLPATPGWVSLPVVVGGPRHSWLRVPGAVPRHSWLGSVGGGVWRGRSLATPGGGSCVLLPATPGWVSVPVVVCGPPPLLAGVRWRQWCVVCGVWCVVYGVWCVVCGGGVLVGLRLVCGVVGSSPLPAEVPVCYSPPLLAGFRCRRWWAFLATPGGGSRARFPTTPGWVSLSAVVCGVWCVVCGVWRAAVACVVGLWLVCGVVGPSPLLAEVPVCYSPPLLAGFRCRWWCGAPRHSWLGPASCGGVFCGRGCPLLCVFVVCVGVRGGRAVLCVACLWCLCFWWCGVVVRWVCRLGALLLGPGVCVCAVWPFVLVQVVWGGGVVRGVAVVRARVCARSVWLVGWGVSYLGWFSSSVVSMFQKAEEEVL